MYLHGGRLGARGKALSWTVIYKLCRSYTIIAIYITVRDGELLSYLSSLARAG